MGQRKRTRGEQNFETSLKKLEEIVRRLEEEEIPLETSLKLFAEGQTLARACEEQLRAAENQVRVLMENASGEIQETDLPQENSTAESTTEDEDENQDPSEPPSGPVESSPTTQANPEDLPF